MSLGDRKVMGPGGSNVNCLFLLSQHENSIYLKMLILQSPSACSPLHPSPLSPDAAPKLSPLRGMRSQLLQAAPTWPPKA